MNRAQLSMAHIDSSVLMSGPPGVFIGGYLNTIPQLDKIATVLFFRDCAHG
jgi:hypothetical protein